MKIIQNNRKLAIVLTMGLALNAVAASMHNMGKVNEIIPLELNDKGLITGKKPTYESQKSGGHWSINDKGQRVWFDDYITIRKDFLIYWDYKNNKTSQMARNGEILLNNNDMMAMEFHLDDKIITNPDGSVKDRISRKAFWLYYPDGKTKELTNIPHELSLCTFDDTNTITLINEKDGTFFARKIEDEENYPISPLADCKSPYANDDFPSTLPSKKRLEALIDDYYYNNTPMPKTTTFQGYEIPLGYYCIFDTYDGDTSKLQKRDYGWKLIELIYANQNKQLIAKMQYKQIDPNEGSMGWGTLSGAYYVFVDLRDS